MRNKYYAKMLAVNVSWKQAIITVMGFITASFVIMAGYVFVHTRAHDDSLKLPIIQEVLSFNNDLPRMIDSETQLTKVSYSNHTINYELELLNRRAEYLNVATMLPNIKNNIRNDICQNADTKMLLNSGYAFAYHYVDQEQAPLFTIKIQQSDCI